MPASSRQKEIVSLVNQLRVLYPEIGEFELFLPSANLDYRIKLSNGTLWVTSGELKDFSENKPDANVLKNIALRFEPASGEPAFQKNKKSKFTGFVRKFLFILLGTGLLGMSAYYFLQPGDKLPDRAAQIVFTEEKAKPLTEEELRTQLLQKEKDNPLKHLTVDFEWKENFWGKVVLEGNVKNSAGLTGYQKIKIKFSFFSQADTLLHEEEYLLTESVEPGREYPFKHKIAPVKGEILRCSYEILSAEPSLNSSVE